MKAFYNIAVCFFILLLMSCGSQVQTTKTTDKDLSTYDSFAYLPNANVDEKYNSEQVSKAVIEVINMNMQKAGYELDRDNPDLLVLVSTKVNRETATRTQPVYSAYPYSAGVTTVNPVYGPYYYRGYNRMNRVVGYDTDTYQYKEGTLVINLVDRNTQETVWKGVALDNIYSQGTNSAIRELVNDIFQQYPLMN